MGQKESSIISKIINIILATCITISSIGLAVIITLNTTIVYRISIDKFNLVKYTGISANKLMSNYEGMINYLGNPFIKELKFNDFLMSSAGRIHFEEVKDIFINIYIIIIIAIVIILLFKLIKKISSHISLIAIFNYSSNLIFILFGFIITMMVVDFSKAFTIFHKIFFNNSYWIFDPITDPIINALPEALFMIYAFIIATLLISEAIAFKLIYYKKRNKK